MGSGGGGGADIVCGGVRWAGLDLFWGKKLALGGMDHVGTEVG